MEKAYVKTAEEVLEYKKKNKKKTQVMVKPGSFDPRKKQKLVGARTERLRQRWQG